MPLPSSVQCSLIADVGDVGTCQHKPQAGIGNGVGSFLSAFRKGREGRRLDSAFSEEKGKKPEAGTWASDSITGEAETGGP